MTSIYRYRTNQYIGPTLDQNLYSSDFLLTQGRITEPTNVQWVTDPSAECTAEQKRLRARGVLSRSSFPSLAASHYKSQYLPFSLIVSFRQCVSL